MKPTVRVQSVTASSAAGAFETARDGGGGGEARGRDFVAAIGAIAVVARVEPLESGADALPLCLSPPGLRLRHSLVLERIHAREPPHRLLIERDGLLAVEARGVFGVEGVEAGGESIARVGHSASLVGMAGGSNPASCGCAADGPFRVIQLGGAMRAQLARRRR